MDIFLAPPSRTQIMYGVFQGKAFRVSIYRQHQQSHVSLGGYACYLDSTEPSSQATQTSGRIYTPMEGVVSRLNVHLGDRVHQGQILCQLESMKLMLEITSPEEGVVVHLGVHEGQKLPANHLILILQPFPQE